MNKPELESRQVQVFKSVYETENLLGLVNIIVYTKNSF